MPRFVFQLDAVLRQRRRVEQQAQRRLAERQMAVTALQRQISQLETQLREANDTLRRGGLTGSIDVDYLIHHRRYLSQSSRLGAGLMSRLAEATRQADAARAELIEAAKGRKVLETLRERQEQKWRAEVTRREQAEADDIAGRYAPGAGPAMASEPAREVPA